MGLRQIVDMYSNSSDATKTAIKTGGIYLGMSSLGNISAAATGNPSIDTLFDISAAPLASAYLLHKLNHIDEPRREKIIIGLSGIIGADWAYELMRYVGSNQTLSRAKEWYSSFNELTNRVLQVMANTSVSPELEGTILGLLAGIVILATSYYHQNPNNQPPNHLRIQRGRNRHHI